MTEAPTIRFEDGAAYERGMGGWSAIAGAHFLDWLAPAPGLRWIDIGCGNGAFTERIVQRCQPASVDGVDPSPGQLSFAETRPGARGARFQRGDALRLPFEDGHFDAAVMALVLFFVPEPPAGVAEMRRVTRPGGTVCAYLWDFPAGGFPIEPIQAEMRAAGMTPALPPHPQISAPAEMLALWQAAGLQDLRQTSFAVERRYDRFDTYWSSFTATGPMKARFETMDAAALDAFKARVRERMGALPGAPFAYTARANAIAGRTPG